MGAPVTVPENAPLEDPPPLLLPVPLLPTPPLALLPDDDDDEADDDDDEEPPPGPSGQPVNTVTPALTTPISTVTRHAPRIFAIGQAPWGQAPLAPAHNNAAGVRHGSGRHPAPRVAHRPQRSTVLALPAVGPPPVPGRASRARWSTLDGVPGVLRPPFRPQESLAQDALPDGSQWVFEPKWDGFRCVAFKDGARVQLQSRNQADLTEAFPEVVAALGAMAVEHAVLDGELVVPVHGTLSIEGMQLRMNAGHANAATMAKELPACLMVFDLLAVADGTPLLELPLEERRARLDGLMAHAHAGAVRCSPWTADRVLAQRWLDAAGSGLEGVMAKKRHAPYVPGDRAGMVKVKPSHTVDCVVGGFRWSADGKGRVSSLLLGLYGEDGLLHHVGYTSNFRADQQAAMAEQLKPFVGPPGFTGAQPEAHIRWSRRDGAWEPLQPILVVEVRYDAFNERQFRHGASFVRYRPDKDPQACSLAQVERPAGVSAELWDHVKQG